MIGGVDMVILEVDDQERAKELWTERIGLTVTTDEPYAGGRWVDARGRRGHALRAATG